MKKIIITMLCICFSTSLWSMTLTKEWNVTLIKFNETKKNYDVSFLNQAGIYNSEEIHIKCLQKSIEKKHTVKVEFQPMGLKILKCSEK